MLRSRLPSPGAMLLLLGACQGGGEAPVERDVPQTAQLAQELTRQQWQEVDSPDPADFGQFGVAAASSRDGHTAVVSAFHRTYDAQNPLGLGAAYVYGMEKGQWSLQAELLPQDGAPRVVTFGWPDVALHGDRVFVSALGLLTDPGAAYVFEKRGDVWQQEARLVPPDREPSFGFRFYLHGDTAFIGAPGTSWNGVLSDGAVYIFARRQGSWRFQQKLSSPDGAHANYFGYALTGNDDTLLVGAPFASAPHTTLPRGAVYVFKRDGDTWTHAELLVPRAPTDGGQFGSSLALAGDTAMVGALLADTPAAPKSGAVYVFRQRGGRWAEQAQLVSDDAASQDLFGYTLILDERRLFVGAPLASAAGHWSGAAYVFHRHGATWTQHAKLLPADLASGDTLGSAGSLAGDRLLLGARGKGDQHSGALYSFAF